MLLITKLIDIIIKPIEWYFNNKRIIKIIDKRIKEWEDYKVRVRR